MRKMKKQRGPVAEVWHYFIKNKGAVVGLIVFGLIAVAAIIGYLTIDYETITTINAKDMLQHPSAEHLFGTDQYGRDIFKRMDKMYKLG